MAPTNLPNSIVRQPVSSLVAEPVIEVWTAGPDHATDRDPPSGVNGWSRNIPSGVSVGSRDIPSDANVGKP